MEIRVLRYFLETAREGNMSRAAERLHISQPTMSKQIKELEAELGAKLFVRSNFSVRLTDAGMLLRKRAEDILDLVDKTTAEFHALDDVGSGEIFVGAAESESVKYFARAVKTIQEQYPGVRCNIFSGNMEDVTERLDKGLLDFAIIMSYVDLSKYNYLAVPASDTWGVIMRKDSPLAKKEAVTLDDLYGLPLICSRQWMDQDFPRWFERNTEKLQIVATFNLVYNAAVMVREGIGYAISYDKLTDTGEASELCFRPLAGVPESEMYVVWRRYQTFTPVAELLLDELRRRFA
ncbi:MAG: LysR family transcriptional regulator [Ruminococcaceae bacterium]|nr:LysR family transcriptional regulator [Oscillospiraceae bacterium]